MTVTPEHYQRRVRRNYLNRILLQANRHVAETQLAIAKQRAIIDGLDRDGHDSALARDLLVILHKTLQMQEDHRERVTRELALGPASADYFTTRRPAA